MFIDLKDAPLIGSGGERDCYQHPHHKNLCIKVSVRGSKTRWKSQSSREPFYYKFLADSGISWKYIAKYHGKIMTSLGLGLVFKIPYDTDGQVSPTLRTTIKESRVNTSTLKLKLESLYNYLLNQSIIAYDLNPDNILMKTLPNNKVRPIIIDGLGKRKMLWAAVRSKTYCKAYMKKRWGEFMQEIEGLMNISINR